MASGNCQRGLAHNILLTGAPGCGKTTVIVRTVEGFAGQVEGFHTREIRERGRRVGFAIETLDGQSGILAHTGLTGGPRIGKYRANIRDIDQIAVPALLRACREADLIICDEIASMELCSAKFAAVVREALQCPTPLVGAIQRKRHPFLDEIRGLDTVRIFEVSPANRDKLPGQILKLIASLRVGQ